MRGKNNRSKFSSYYCGRLILQCQKFENILNKPPLQNKALDYKVSHSPYFVPSQYEQVIL